MTASLMLALVMIAQQPEALERRDDRKRCESIAPPARARNPLKPPKLKARVEPSWPATNEARGTVVLLVGINEKGDVTCVEIVRSIPINDQAAIDAVRQWKYEPATVKGKPIAVVLTVRIEKR